MRSIALLVVFLGLVWPVTGFAQDEAAVAKARELNEEGTALFEAGDFEQAAKKYRAAYETVPDPFLLGSESVAWFEAGDCEQSLAVVDEFSATLSEGEGLPKPLLKVRAGCAIRAAEAAVETKDYATAESELERAAAMEGITDKQSTRIAELRSRIDDEKTAAASGTENTARKEGRGGGSVRPIIGWGLVVAGAGLAGASVVPGLGFRENNDSYEELRDGCDPVCSDEAYEEEGRLRDEMRRQRVAFYALTGAGAAMAAVGAVVLLRGASENDAQVFLGPTGAAFLVRF